MRKKLLLVSGCALALLAGCTQENATGPDKNSEGPSFTATIVNNEDPASKVTIGDYVPDAKNTAIYWNPGDLIGIYANYANKGEYANNNKEYMATTATQAATTSFNPTSTYDSGKIIIPAGTTGAIQYYACHPKPVGTVDFSQVGSPMSSTQKYLSYSKNFPDKVFMVAYTEVANMDVKNVDLQFTNAFATISVGLKGSAKIEKLTVTSNTTMENGGTPLTYPAGGTVDLSKAPKAGGTELQFWESGFYTPSEGAEGSMSVTMVFDAPFQLTSETKWVPMKTLPFFFYEELGFDITLYGTDKDGKPVEITRTIKKTEGADEADVRTNEIAYLSLKEVNASDMNQDAPKSDWVAGEELFSDDFHWITELPEWADVAKYNTNGWANSYVNPGFTQNNEITGSSKLAEFTKQGYMLPTTGKEGDNSSRFSLLHSYDGMLRVGNSNTGVIVIPLPDLYTATKDVTVKFRAARYVNKYGDTEKQLGAVPMIIKGAGTIKGHTEELPAYNTVDQRFTAYPAGNFTWSDYTVVIEGANAETKIFFGDVYATTKNYFFIDNINISIANGETTSAITGTPVAKEEAKFIYVKPDAGTTFELSPLKGESKTIEFAATCPWNLEFSEATVPTWLEVSKVLWSGWDDPAFKAPLMRRQDDLGNQLSNVFTIKTLEDNDSGAERSFTIKIKTGATELATYTIKQPVAAAKKVLYAVDFGTQTKATEKATSTMGATEWGLGSYEPTWLGIEFDADGNNGGLYLSNAKPQSAVADEAKIIQGTYNGATPGGNLLFYKAVNPATPATPEAKFSVNVPVANLADQSSLSVNFGLWGSQDAQDIRGGFNVDVDFGTEAKSITLANASSLYGWGLMENAFTIPDGATKCDISIYPTTPGRGTYKSAFRIDDVNIYTRGK